MLIPHHFLTSISAKRLHKPQRLLTANYISTLRFTFSVEQSKITPKHWVLHKHTLNLMHKFKIVFVFPRQTLSQGNPFSMALYLSMQMADGEWSFLAADLEDQVFLAEMALLQEMIAELRPEHWVWQSVTMHLLLSRPLLVMAAKNFHDEFCMIFHMEGSIISRRRFGEPFWLRMH